MPTFTMRRSSSGQAAIEFIVCIILLLLIITGMIHVATMGRASIYIHAAIRGRAGERAMGGLVGSSPRNISDWNPGADGVRYTADDVPAHGGAANIASDLTGYSVATPDDWSAVRRVHESLRPASAVRLHDTDMPFLRFAHGEDTIKIEISSVIRQLVYDKETVTVKEEVWMPMMGGLY
jgi:hypothetical protein